MENIVNNYTQMLAAIFNMTFRLSIIIGLIILQSCNRTDLLTELRRKEIDSLWTIETTDSLSKANSHYLRQFCHTRSGKVIWLDTLTMKNKEWPEDIASFHDILFNSDHQAISSRDIVVEYPKFLCSSLQYYDFDGNVVARQINNKYFDKTLKKVVIETKLEFYKTDMTILSSDSILQDDYGNKLLEPISRPECDAQTFPAYKNIREFITENKLDS